MSRIITTALAVAVVAMTIVGAATGAVTKDRKVRVNGTCTSSASSKLKLGAENGRIEVEFEVDQNRNGVRWRVVLKRNGSPVATTVATTRGPSGSFTVRRIVGNAPGATDRIVAVATSPTGATCRAAASF